MLSSETHAPATMTTTPTTSSYPMPSPRLLAESPSSVSLTVNYLPKKFSSTLLSGGGGGGGGSGSISSSARRRKNATAKLNDNAASLFPKRGGGAEAFRSGEARMPYAGGGGGGYEDASSSITTAGGGKKLKWNKFKWILFVLNLLFTMYTLAGLIVCLLTWFNVFTHADVVRVGNRAELVLCTLAASFGLFTSSIGWAGILLNNRSFLALYAFLTWITFALLVTPGYISYKKRTFNLEGKINSQWSRSLDTADRLRIQDELQCCGYYNPFIEATVTATCYSRSVLPGCKAAYLAYERRVLKKFYTAVFGCVPLQIAVMVAALLCSNHVTYRFGKGMMPKAYRLNLDSMAVIMDQYASQLADRYGQDIASDVLARSRANLLQFDSMASMPYQTPSSRGSSRTHVHHHAKYDSLSECTKAPASTDHGRPTNWF
jgi:hypothetical protein